MKDCKMYLHTVFILFLITFSFNAIKADQTSCETSQKLFADLCFSPTPQVDDFDFTMLTRNESHPETTHWYTHIGNDIEQLHVSEVLKGELQSPKDDFSDLCYYFTIEHSENATGDGKISGYGNLTSDWDCKHSLDFPGAEFCDIRSTLSKYHEDVLQYISYKDRKTEFSIYISCYPNGQVGWGTYSSSPKLTNEENKFALEYAENLGFPKDTNVVLFGDHCSL